MVAIAGPWPGSFYSAPLALALAAGLIGAAIVLHRVVRRPRVASDAELRAIDDIVRERAAQTITAACGVLVAVPLAGTAIIAGGVLLRTACTPSWVNAAGWGLLLVAPGTLGTLGWFTAVLLAPVRSIRPSQHKSGPR
jgi:hypothetical protein